jgi:hypothetical protein
VKTNKKQKEWGHGSRLQWKALGKHEALNSIFNTAHHTQKKSNLKKSLCWALTPVILATQEAKIRRIVVRSQPGQIVLKTLSQKTLSQKVGLVNAQAPVLKINKKSLYHFTIMEFYSQK